MVEVWGHRSSGLNSNEDEFDNHLLNTSSNDAEVVSAQKQKRLQELWAGVTRRIELWVEIKELNENGDYESVEVTNGDVATGGIYQLKQVSQVYSVLYSRILGLTTSFKCEIKTIN
jgi:hypothetical protein